MWASNTHKNDIHENLYWQRICDSNYSGLLSLTKEIIPMKCCDHENFYVYNNAESKMEENDWKTKQLLLNQSSLIDLIRTASNKN